MFFNNFAYILIGINIGAAIGWFACKHFKGDIAKLMEWLDT